MSRKEAPTRTEFSADPEKFVTDPAEAQEIVRKITGEAERERRFAEILDSASAGTVKKSAGTGRGATSREKKSAGTGAKKGRAKARNGSEKLTPAALYRKMLRFGKNYQVETEQDFIEAARIYAEEAGLIDQMRDRIAEDGLTVEKTYKTGSVEVAHPLLSELPRHVESANKCLTTIGNMIGERGARVEKAARDLDAFRLH